MYTKEEIEELEAKDKVANSFCQIFRQLYPMLKSMEKRKEIVIDDKYGDVLILHKDGHKRITGLEFWHRIAELMKGDWNRSYLEFKKALIA